MKSALIVIDMQYDICDGGPMANVNSLNIIPIINSIRDNYDFVIFIKKSPPDNSIIFKQNGGIYPRHCVINTHGNDLHNDLIIKQTDLIVNRCTRYNYNSNSGFYDDETTNKQTKLKYFLQVNGIKNLYFCGNNMDTCIFSTVFDALNYKFNCNIIVNVIGYVNKEICDDKIKFLGTLGVKFR